MFIRLFKRHCSIGILLFSVISMTNIWAQDLSDLLPDISVSSPSQETPGSGISTSSEGKKLEVKSQAKCDKDVSISDEEFYKYVNPGGGFQIKINRKNQSIDFFYGPMKAAHCFEQYIDHQLGKFKVNNDNIIMTHFAYKDDDNGKKFKECVKETGSKVKKCKDDQECIAKVVNLKTFSGSIDIPRGVTGKIENKILWGSTQKTNGPNTKTKFGEPVAFLPPCTILGKISEDQDVTKEEIAEEDEEQPDCINCSLQELSKQYNWNLGQENLESIAPKLIMQEMRKISSNDFENWDEDLWDEFVEYVQEPLRQEMIDCYHKEASCDKSTINKKIAKLKELFPAGKVEKLEKKGNFNAASKVHSMQLFLKHYSDLGKVDYSDGKKQTISASVVNEKIEQEMTDYENGIELKQMQISVCQGTTTGLSKKYTKQQSKYQTNGRKRFQSYSEVIQQLATQGNIECGKTLTEELEELQNKDKEAYDACAAVSEAFTQLESSKDCNSIEFSEDLDTNKELCDKSYNTSSKSLSGKVAAKVCVAKQELETKKKQLQRGTQTNNNQDWWSRLFQVQRYPQQQGYYPQQQGYYPQQQYNPYYQQRGYTPGQFSATGNLSLQSYQQPTYFQRYQQPQGYYPQQYYNPNYSFYPPNVGVQINAGVNYPSQYQYPYYR